MTHSQRFLSLNVFRGLTVAAMILVNNPGSWSYVYTPLEHAPWHGCTPTYLDLYTAEGQGLPYAVWAADLRLRAGICSPVLKHGIPDQ